MQKLAFFFSKSHQTGWKRPETDRHHEEERLPYRVLSSASRRGTRYGTFLALSFSFFPRIRRSFVFCSLLFSLSTSVTHFCFLFLSPPPLLPLPPTPSPSLSLSLLYVSASFSLSPPLYPLSLSCLSPALSSVSCSPSLSLHLCFLSLSPFSLSCLSPAPSSSG